MAGLAAAATADLAASAARADTPAIDATSVGTYPPLSPNGFNYFQRPGNYTFTWDFTANSPIQITQLGYYDSALAGTPEPNGFGSHFLTLFDVTTDQTLATTTVTALSPATGLFNYEAITPVALNTTDTYEVSGTMTTQYYLVGLNQSAAPTAPQINYNFTAGNIFGSPSPPGTYGDFGPNFQFAAASRCTENVTGRNVIALAGDVCVASPANYHPTTTAVVLPVVYNGFGFYAHGGTITSAGVISITTTNPNDGSGSYGVWADTTGSQITLSGSSAVTTAGDTSHGVYASGGGHIDSPGALSVATTGAGAFGVYASGAGSSITAALGAISTTGVGAFGVQADGGGVVTLQGGTISTSGAGAWGLSADGPGSLISATGVTVATTGGTDASGNVALGAFARNGATMTLTDTTFMTSGASAHGVEAGGGSTITISGGSVTTGGANAFGLFSTDPNSSITTSNGVAVSTSGLEAHGVFVGSGAGVNLSGGTIATSGAVAVGVFVNGAGSNLTANGVTISTTGGFDPSTGNQAWGFGVSDSATATLTNDTISATGAQGHGVSALTGGKVIISGGTVTVGGVDADGLLANGAGSKITTAGGLVVTSTATPSVFTLAGARADFGGVLDLSATTITTAGAGVVGVGVETAAAAALNGVTVSTSGEAAHAISVTGAGSTVTLGGANILTTVGNGALGIFAGSGGVVTETGSVAISTSGTNALSNGLSSFGVNADGKGSAITLGSATIVTAGQGAVGILASDRNATGSGGVVTVNGALNVTTQAAFAYDVFASGAGSRIALNGATTLNVGSGAFGLYATGGGVIAAAGNLNITDANAGFGGGVEADAGSLITLGGTSSISLTSTNLVGLFATTGGTITSSAGLTVNAGANFGVIAQGGAINLGGPASITTNGANAHGVDATQGGAVKATNALFVTTSGAGAVGLNANGVGSSIVATNVAIATSGASAAALRADNGGALTITGGTISTSGALSNGLYGAHGATINLAGVQVTTTGNGAKGLYVQNASTSLNGSNLTVQTFGTIDPTTGLHAIALYNGNGSGAGSGSTGGATVSLTTSAFATHGDFSGAVATENGGLTTLTRSSAATSGGQSDAIYGSSASTTALSYVTLTTMGNASKGIDIEGTGTSLTGANLTITTHGAMDPATSFHAQGVYNGSSTPAGAGTTGGGSVSLLNASVTTHGDKAFGVDTANGGATFFTAGSISTSGAGAVALLATAGATTHVATNAGVGTIISTTGNSAAGVFAGSGGAITLLGATISASGDGSIGLSLSDQGSSITATNVTISTTGGFDSNTGFYAHALYNGPGLTGTSGGALSLNNVTAAAQGVQSAALVTDAGGVTSATGGAFSTTGAGAPAVSVLNGGALTISGATLTTTGDGSPGLIINGTGGSVVASNLTINTSGGVWLVNGSHADGVYNGTFGNFSGGGVMQIANSSVTTTGVQAYGVSVGAGGTTTFLGGAIATSGVNSNAARADGGSLTIGLDAQGKATAISTAGAGSYAAAALGGGVISLTGATIATTGDGSGGVGVNGAGSKIDATGVTISTLGGIDPVSGLHAYGAANTPFGSFATGGVLNLTNVAISTAGDVMYGVYTGASSTTTFAGGSVSTSGAAAHALYTTGAGANLTASGVVLSTTGAGAFGAATFAGGVLTLGQGTQIATTGANAHGLYVVDAGSQVKLAGSVAIAVAGAGAAGVYVESGGAVASAAALSISAKTYGVFLNGATAPAEFAASGPLSLKTTDPSGAAVTLTGNSVTFAATGGGLIQAAGTGVSFLNGVNQSATFKNVEIDAPSGDLIFADPTTATIAFDNSFANAGTGNLAHVVGGSDLTLTALASTLIGAVVTDPGSSSTLTLTGGSVWTITGNSTASNLNLVNSSAMFAPSTSGFHTLTVNSYSGTGAGLTFNAALGGANPGADQLIINGGQATGSTTVSIRLINLASAQAIGAALPAAAAGPPPNVPIVVTSNGGTIAPNAFALAAPLVVGDTVYSLQQQPGGEFLVGAQGQSASQLSGSLASLSQSRQAQAVTSRVLGSILTGATEQINCSSCSSGFASFGSFAVGVHGRWTLSPSVALMAGLSYDNYTAKGVSVNNALLGALGVRYDMVELGKYRPFFEAGVAVSPYANVTFRRSYLSSLGSGVGVGDTLSRSVAAYGRAGYIWRLSPRDEAAAYTDLTRSWQSTAGYLESANPGNPFGTLVAPSLDTMNIWKVGAQFTHLFGDHVEANISAGYALAFDSKYSSTASLAGLSAAGAAPAGFDWAELGGRLSYRFSTNLIADAFVLGTVGAEPAGKQVHGGVALRMAF